MHTPETKHPGEHGPDGKLIEGTGNLKHIFKTGLPPGVEPEDVTDPGMKALRETTGSESPPETLQDIADLDRDEDPENLENPENPENPENRGRS